MDDNEYEEQESPTKGIRINCADFAYSAVLIPRGLFEGFAAALRNLEASFAHHSVAISERQEFEKTVGQEIERLSEVRRDG